MIIDRLLDLSVYYYIKNVFVDAPFISVTDGFPEEGLTIPTVAVEMDNIDTYNAELGNRVRGKVRTWYIDIYAADKAQRDEYACRLMSELENSIPVYNYDEGFPPSSTPSRIGSIVPENLRLQIIKVLPDLTEKMYYRSLVVLTGEYDPS